MPLALVLEQPSLSDFCSVAFFAPSSREGRSAYTESRAKRLSDWLAGRNARSYLGKKFRNCMANTLPERAQWVAYGQQTPISPSIKSDSACHRQ